MSKFIFYVSVVLLFAGSSKGPSPGDVVCGYLDALLQGDKQEAYKYVFGREWPDSALFLKDVDLSAPRIRMVIRQISYTIKEVSQKENTTKVNIELTRPDELAITDEVLQHLFSFDLSGRNEEEFRKKVEKLWISQLERLDVPITMDTITYSLIKEEGVWRVAVDPLIQGRTLEAMFERLLTKLKELTEPPPGLPPEIRASIVPFWIMEVKPEPVSIPIPEYPISVREAGIEGWVVVRALIDLDGSIRAVKLLKSSGSEILDQAALTAAKKAEFKPVQYQGQLVRVWVSIPYRFILGARGEEE